MFSAYFNDEDPLIQIFRKSIFVVFVPWHLLFFFGIIDV
jgi:hypothetical protein